MNKDDDTNYITKIKNDINYVTARKNINWTENHAIQKLHLHLRYHVQDKSKSYFSFLIAFSRFWIAVLDMQVSLKKLILTLRKSTASFIIRTTLKKNNFSVHLFLARVSARRSRSRVRRFKTFKPSNVKNSSKDMQFSLFKIAVKTRWVDSILAENWIILAGRKPSRVSR